MRTIEEIVEAIRDEGIIGVVRFEEAELAAGVAEAFAENGLRSIEITMTSPGALDLIADLSHRLRPGGVVVAAGTVRGSEDARLAHEAGAEVLVSPHTDKSVLDYARQNGLVCIAGAATPSEIIQAWEWGAPIVKIYPARLLGGPDYIRTIRQPIRGIEMLAGGPVSVEEIPRYFDAGVVAVNMGDALAPLEFVEQNRWEEVAQRVGHARATVQEWRKARTASA
jgi:2-dehydro-3-deoxyphosphogluconate aldolase / (4S)-4-hydroxy-2-oxoglutarate aldolase